MIPTHLQDQVLGWFNPPSRATHLGIRWSYWSWLWLVYCNLCPFCVGPPLPQWPSQRAWPAAAAYAWWIVIAFCFIASNPRAPRSRWGKRGSGQVLDKVGGFCVLFFFVKSPFFSGLWYYYYSFGGSNYRNHLDLPQVFGGVAIKLRGLCFTKQWFDVFCQSSKLSRFCVFFPGWMGNTRT